MKIELTYTCLSVRQPWVWLMFSLPPHIRKNIENRSQRCHKRGTIAIHASTTNTKKEYAAALALIADRGLDITLPPIEELVTGAIVGLIDIVDCVTESDSPWFTGESTGGYGLVLANPRSGIPQPQKGQQGFFPVDYEFHPAAEPLTRAQELVKSRLDFGQCRKCGGAVKIPGLDRYLCAGDCGWQFQLSELHRMQQGENAKASKGKNQSSIANSTLFDYEN